MPRSCPWPALALSLLLTAAAPLAASSIGMKAYLALKEDSNLYTGEATVLPKDHANLAEAKAAARSQALANLAESIQVEVKSQVQEKLSSENGKVDESVKSVAEAKAHLVLENVHYLELNDFPDPGQLSVMASLSKEDYRRQLAGKKVSVYLPEHTLKVKVMMNGPDWLVGHYQPGMDLGLEVGFSSWIVGAYWEGDTVQSPNSHGLNLPDTAPNFSLFGADLGYNWTPWATRAQLYFPFRLQYQWVGLSTLTANLGGASAGLGFRYWPSDFVALDLTARYVAGFNTVQMQPYPPGYDPLQANMTGPQIDIGLLWSGF
jgi:hypothetical protein